MLFETLVEQTGLKAKLFKSEARLKSMIEINKEMSKNTMSLQDTNFDLLNYYCESRRAVDSYRKAIVTPTKDMVHKRRFDNVMRAFNDLKADHRNLQHYLNEVTSTKMGKYVDGG